MSSAAEDNDRPVQFSKSPAFKHRPGLSYEVEEDKDKLWYEPHVIMASLAAFMIYFFILREENDIDERLGGKSLDAQLRSYEIDELKKTIASCKIKEVNTRELEDRLDELIYLNNIAKQ